MRPALVLPACGVGLGYTPALPAELYRPGVIDFVEITPDTLCRMRQDVHGCVMTIVPEQLAQAQQTCANLPLCVHGVELSIGSAHGMNDAYLAMLDRFQAVWPFAWHSEHLSFQTFRDSGGAVRDTGVPLPLPATEEAAQRVAQRCVEIHRRYGVPFLLENPVHYLPRLPADRSIGDDIGLMNHIVRAGGCGQLLDLHNLYCNAVNFGLDAFTAIDRMCLDQVGEIHIAGGSWSDGFRVDAHDNAVPAAVWDLLDYALPRCRNAAGVVFEILDEHVARVGADAVAADLARARAAWRSARLQAMPAEPVT